jgi:hypothetical protein
MNVNHQLSDVSFLVFENFIEVLQVDGHAVELSLWDTAGELLVLTVVKVETIC